MNDWQPISKFPKHEQNKLRWLVRHAPTNGIVEAGAAVKFGREWQINPQRLPDFLQQLTLNKRAAKDVA